MKLLKRISLLGLAVLGVASCGKNTSDMKITTEASIMNLN